MKKADLRREYFFKKFHSLKARTVGLFALESTHDPIMAVKKSS